MTFRIALENGTGALLRETNNGSYLEENWNFKRVNFPGATAK